MLGCLIDLPQLIDESINLAEWLRSRIDGMEAPNDERSVLVASCFHIVLEHHQSITLLTSKGLHGSAFALVRPVYETFIRGLRLNHCAKPKEIKDYRSDKLKKEFRELLKEVEISSAWNTGVLQKIKEESWKAMNSFTHSGILQTSRRFNGNDIESAYSPNEISKTLKFCCSIAILSGIAFSKLADNLELASIIHERAIAFRDSVSL